MRLRIKSVSMDNFQCHKEEVFEFSDSYNEFRGFNGVGKTTVLNAIVWCLTGEDYLGSKKPTVSPIVNGEIAKEKTIVTTTLVSETEDTEIEAEFEIKRAFSGSASTIYVNGIKHKKTEYISYMEEKLGIKMEEFGLLTNPNYISSMAWKDARNLIMGLVQSIDDKNVFETTKEFDPIKEKVLEYGAEKFRKSIHEQNAENKNNTIPNLNGRIESYLQNIDEVKNTMESLRELQTEKADIIVRLNTYDERMEREIEKSNASAKVKTEIGDLSDNLREIENKISDILIEGKEIASEIKLKSNTEHIKKAKINEIEDKIRRKEYDLENYSKNLDSLKEKIQKMREHYDDVKNEDISIDSTCPTCGQDLPTEKVEEIKEKSIAKKRENLLALGADYKKVVEEYKTNNESYLELKRKYELDLYDLEMAKECDYSDLIDNEEITVLKDKRAKLLESYNQKDIEKKKIAADIEALKAKLENLPKPQQIESPYADRERLDIINSMLIDVENAKKWQEKLDEEKAKLDTKVKELAKGELIEQLIVDYQKYKAKMVAEEMGNYFKITSFITTETQKNGEEKETFKLLMDNRPYNMLSTGEKVRVGLDLLNGIQRLKNANMPILIDSMGELSEVPTFMIDKQFISCRTVAIPKETSETTEVEREKNRKYVEAYSKLRFVKL